LDPKLPIRPGIVRVRTKLKSPLARLILANSITLTPGTFVVDIQEDIIYVHWIEVCCEDDPQAITENIAGPFEKILAKIYE
jgi:multicomponent Na+:H+ antiporter subunit E